MIIAVDHGNSYIKTPHASPYLSTVAYIPDVKANAKGYLTLAGLVSAG